jgi:hypothetical protein
MPTLHIEHPITDFETWHAAFDQFADRRRQGGVVSERILQPVDDDHYVVIDLDFTTAEEARGFLQFLQAQVWSTSSNAPALAGTPQTRILDTAPVTISG